MMDLKEIEALMQADRLRREREAPRTLRQLEGYVLYTIAFSLAAVYEEEMHARPHAYGPHPFPPEKNRVKDLYLNDPMFAALVRSATSNIMVMVEDYFRKAEDR